MRVSHDKLNKLAHVIADTLAETDECEFHEDRNTIRQESRKMLEKVCRGTEDRPGRAPKVLRKEKLFPKAARSGKSFIASITRKK